jgi:glycosyltransferase involved in cell wall biosynthesis
MAVSRIKVVALVEGHVVTGPAKNILRFAADCRDRVDLTIVTILRTSRKDTREASNNQLVSMAHNLNIPIEIVREDGPYDLTVLSSLRGIFEHHKANIVETHWTKSHFLVSLLRRRKFSWVAFHHGYTMEDLKVRFYQQFDRWSLRFCDAVVTVCGEFATMLESRGVRRNRISVVHNSVNTDVPRFHARFSEEAHQQCNASRERIIISVGRLSPEKGHNYLIDAVSKIVSASPELNLKVLIAGSGPFERTLKEQISDQGLTQHVKLIGYCSDLDRLFSIADLFVLPSLSEGSPNVLLESMAARVPIVAAMVGGVTELVKNGESAILVPPANSECLKTAILELLTNRSKAIRLANVAFEDARVLFNASKRDELLLSIYRRVMHERSG